MLSSLIAAAEPSHVPFFIAGGVFALWAVVLSYIGLSRPAFPYGATGQRAVIAFSFLLSGLAIAMAIVSS